ncbi:type II secretion system F family protein [Streptomyces kronopolitis]|uniref:type II secretion system F family protein n=1 Tax=Streptomyces kronopolitis TaxID=1612435 RepID=UPI0036C9F1D5
MNTLSVMVASGAVVGVGFALLVRQFSPSPPRLDAALRRLNPPPQRVGQPLTPRSPSREEVWGRWLADRLPVRLPCTDLRLVNLGVERFVYSKAVLALLGLVFPPCLALAWVLLGLTAPLFVPAVAGVALGAVLWFVPDYSLRQQAAAAREEFAYALAAYVELVALRLASNAGPTQALHDAAGVGEGWPLVRMREALLRSRLEKIPPWDALEDLGQELALEHMADFADVMRRSSNDGAAVYEPLRARSRAASTQLLAQQAAVANAASEKMTAPGALMAAIVMFAIAFPAALNILAL